MSYTGTRTALDGLYTRRDLLAAASGVGLALNGSPAPASSLSRLSPEEVKARLRGPILSIPTPFTADFGVDYQGVRNMIHLGLAHGVQVYELTAGNSRYDVLSDDEIKQLTRVVVETVNGRGIV